MPTSTDLGSTLEELGNLAAKTARTVLKTSVVPFISLVEGSNVLKALSKPIETEVEIKIEASATDKPGLFRPAQKREDATVTITLRLKEETSELTIETRE